ncbi:aerobic-type carbon monoxide dehydrogenase small subunit (CoxS/CutS family) [Streptomyces achromogenes]|uniref:Aerobic-type carbon monoxide dehydrogenase small subunit (CoxS/CutS family) n=1 Tax=Streptomyces achromogenes TaxID=67255 RepID=A0ABU0Q1Y3_STRAH|nr:2Fe-2S iron-sulfur cluster-binding protein [Streptomyces achromogenes]MDQ0684161.1 aerobic-type carbon monoxide dehydrogenase small subunit (CoxS/CutS family) [Streptomyces achromogenes]
MTDDQHGPGHGQENGRDQGAPQGAGRWDPLPHGDYDDGATAFVKLPEGGIDALLAGRGDSPLAAPGHGYVPPQIAVAPPADDAATWAAPAGGDWPVAQDTPQTVGDDRFRYNPGATGQWTFEDASAGPGAPPSAPAPGHDVTGQWSIPVAGGDLPDESGEFTASALVEQWGSTPPATLPGGASAPWATEPPDTAHQTWAQPADEAGQPVPQATDPEPYGHAPAQLPPHGTGTPFAPEHDPSAAADDRVRPDAEPAAPHSHPSGAFGPEVSAEAYTVPADGPAATARQATEAEGAAGTPGEPESAREAAHGPAGAVHRPARPPAGQAAADDDAPAGDAPQPHAPDPHAPDPHAPDPHAPDPHAPDPHAPDPHASDPEPAADEGAGDVPPPFHEEHPLAGYVLRVNGSDRPVTDAWIGESLLYVLRERLGLAGAKDGCSQGECGACNVQVDGRLVASCLVPAVTTAGSEIRTVEGLAVDGQPSDVQRALAACGAVQCGFCVPGMAMTVHDLLEGNPAPSELEARQALCGNLCRCSGYRGVLQAVQDVVAERQAHADAETDGDEARIPHQAGPGAGGVHASAFENPAQPHPHDPAYGQGQDGGQA